MNRQERSRMSQIEEMHIALHAPNIINICIDEYTNGELSGRIYHCYDNKPQPFTNVIRMVEAMEDFFDRISFPQASTQTRSFANAAKKSKDKPEKVLLPQEVAAQRGKKGTFLTCVKYRQNSSWQGDVEWIEKGVVLQFVSVLELLKILSNALETDIESV